jgi:gamma-glutamyl:cysteine ligase YbdK (ATP-grasp superfamily)
MGQDITGGRYQKQDFDAFRARLTEETDLLHAFLREGRFGEGARTGGYEVEAWLVDDELRPAPINEDFLEKLDDPMVVPELSSFNVELNTEPRVLQGDALRRMHEDLDRVWSRCREAASQLGAELLTTGILPTVQDDDLVLENMSRRPRYRALNEQILRLRKGEPIHLDIAGREVLDVSHHNVMLEAAATSFQIHLKVGPEEAARYFNASIVLSAPMVAACANSPFLFGRDLWDETRIPLFEQAVSVRSTRSRGADRVNFGTGYAQESLVEFFDENIARYDILLPEPLEETVDRFPHARLHNGTIWRWNRPLIGLDDDGRPHFRIEHRVVPSGPSLVDMIANAAFYFGLVHGLVEAREVPENQLTFEQARANFYNAARQGLNAHITWLDGETVPVQALLMEELIPLAGDGLRVQGFDEADVDYYVGILRDRVSSWCNGTAWQRAWVESHGRDMTGLATAMLRAQQGRAPVHEWEI